MSAEQSIGTIAFAGCVITDGITTGGGGITAIGGIITIGGEAPSLLPITNAVSGMK